MKQGRILHTGFSPCPNDTFIFEAVIHNRIENQFEWNPVLADVETLNREAQLERFDVTKLSFGAYAFQSAKYQILPSGAALGFGSGPLIISKKQIDLSQLKNLKIAVPGKLTTACLLLDLLIPGCDKKVEMNFADIIGSVKNGDCDAGLIIHESRFTYSLHELVEIADLGKMWENITGLPVPLGCIAVKRNLVEQEKINISHAVRNSLLYAMKDPDISKDYISMHAQEMDPEIQQKHIQLYVNDFSIDLGEEGKDAIRTLFSKAKSEGLLPEITEPVFIDDNYQNKISRL